MPLIVDDENVWLATPETHAEVVPPTQLPKVPHVHVESQVWVLVPPVPHDALSVAPGVHTPSPLHAPHDDQPLERQVRDCVPHLPQACVPVAPRVPHEGASPMQLPYEPQSQPEGQV